jgi:AcrR family transcriptional regulator
MQPVTTKNAEDSSEESSKRHYNSTRRSRQAAQTREEILTAAIELFSESGWAGTTLAAIAERAGVAVETIYAGFGSKKRLLRIALDVAIAGDTAEMPVADRPEARRLGEGSTDDRMHAAAALSATVHGRTLGIIRALNEAARNDDEVEKWRHELNRARRKEVEIGLERVLDDKVTDDQFIDLIWALLSPGVYDMLVEDAGMSRAQYETTMYDALKALKTLL